MWYMIPVSQRVPVHPDSQLHWNDPARLVHEPWTHGDCRHSLMSEVKQFQFRFPVYILRYSTSIFVLMFVNWLLFYILRNISYCLL